MAPARPPSRTSAHPRLSGRKKGERPTGRVVSCWPPMRGRPGLPGRPLPVLEASGRDGAARAPAVRATGPMAWSRGPGREAGDRSAWPGRRIDLAAALRQKAARTPRGRRWGVFVCGGRSGRLAVIPPVLPTYARAPLAFVEGEGRVADRGERRALPRPRRRHRGDALGHAQPGAGRGAGGAGAAALAHLEPLPHPEPGGAGASGWSAATFADTVFVTNSGTEAIECAIKMARKHFDHAGRPERVRIIAFEGAFHGRSYRRDLGGGLGEDGQGLRAADAGLRPPAVRRPRRGRARRSGRRRRRSWSSRSRARAASGRCRATDLRALRALCDAHGLLLILDEVQCGMGRTGRLFAPRMGGDRARHHGGRQGHRRRLPARRLPRHRGGGGRHDRRAPTARPTAATRSPARSAAR